MGAKRMKKQKPLKDMTTTELAVEAFRLQKQCKRDTKKIERQLAQLAALLGVQVRLV